MDEHAARRRPLLKAALGGAATIGVLGGTVRWWPLGEGPGSSPSPLALVGDPHDEVDALEVPIRSDGLVRSGARWRTRELTTTAYSMLAVVWDRVEDAPDLAVRIHNDGTWSGWSPVPVLRERPDRGTEEDAARGGTDLVWVGRADGVQLRGDGRRPAGLRLLLLKPWGRPEDAIEAAPAVRSATSGQVPRPEIRGRERWGAQESWRDGEPRYNRTIQQVHIHHTAGSNGYARADVPALLRGIYRYHTHYLGWSDVGYNFLVDRFGRIWTGRAGGAQLPVRGAHTLGFNATSTGIAVIGNYETAKPSGAVVEAIAALAAWKLRPYGRDPIGLARVWCEGSDKYRAGRTVSLPVIDGHRNTNDTACPGRHLYAALPEIRRRTRHLIRWYAKVHVLARPEVHGHPTLGATLSVVGGRFAPGGVELSYAWLRDGKRIDDADHASYVVRPADAGARLSVRVVARSGTLKPARRTLWSSRRVVVPSSVRLVARARGDGRLRVDVHVDSPAGVRDARGEVVVRVGDRRAVVRLTNGHGVARFGWTTPLAKGRHRVHAHYGGDRAHEPAQASVRTRVRR